MIRQFQCIGRRGTLPVRWPLSLVIAAVVGTSAVTARAETNLAAELAARALVEPPRDDAATTAQTVAMPVLELLVRGGWLMVPIGLASVVVVALGVERMLALRRSQILPAALATSLSAMADRRSADPLALGRLCEEFPSSTARIVEAILHKVGRSAGELEHALAEAAQHEADRLYTNVRTINLATTVTPLLGLLGTVWGMIQAFFVTASMPIGSNKGQALAEGIYVALVTTFAGLSVAIPAAVLSHLLENRILRLLGEVRQRVGELLPQLARHDARLRIDEPHATPGPMTAPRPTVRRDAKAS